MDSKAETPAQRSARGEELLAQGDYAQGFRLYDAWRQAYPHLSADWQIPTWRGESLNGQGFLIVGEQGFGDQIMHARFAKLLQAQGAQVAWLCKPPLLRLLNECFGIRAAPFGIKAIEGFSYYSPACRLPNLFFPPLTAPPAEPYLEPPRPNVLPGLTIGVVTKGNPRFLHDPSRSLPATAAEALLSLPGAFSLLPEDTGARDFYDTATIVAGLDLVISVDTAAAHLAGAMGKPVWVLLSAERTDWRWMNAGGTNPWYPSARLFRQSSPGDWNSVVNQVCAAVAI